MRQQTTTVINTSLNKGGYSPTVHHQNQQAVEQMETQKQSELMEQKKQNSSHLPVYY